MKKSTHVKLAILLVLLKFACAISIQIDLSFDQAKQNTCLLQCTSISSQQCCFLFELILFLFNKLIPRGLCSLGKISFILSTKPIKIFSFFSYSPSLLSEYNTEARKATSEQISLFLPLSQKGTSKQGRKHWSAGKTGKIE